MWPAMIAAVEDVLKTPVPVVDWTSVGFSGSVLILFGWLITKHIPAMEEKHRKEREEAETQCRLERERMFTRFEIALDKMGVNFKEAIKEIVNDRRDYRQHVRRSTHRIEDHRNPHSEDPNGGSDEDRT